MHAHSTVNGAWYQWGHFVTLQVGPEHTLELPTPSASVSSPVSVQGWAIDASAPSGTGVSAVSVWSHRNPGSGEPGVWHGYATYGANRPTVAASHGERFRYSGYTGSFSPATGQHYFGVSSQSSHTQVWTTQTRTIYVGMTTVPLTIDRPGTGTGGVTASGLTCAGGSTTQAMPCGANYPLHTVVTLTAVPDPNSTFAGWGGACTGTGTCQVTLSMARLVTATFTKLPSTIALRYYHTDPIGSVRAITDEVGGVVARNDYRPFGEDVASLTGDPNRFAGKQLDPETALHYFDARYYRQTWGRFTQVDPLHVGAAMTDPQQWNRYAYARNNPLAYGDPTGLCVNTVIEGVTYCVSESVSVTGTSDPVQTIGNNGVMDGGIPGIGGRPGNNSGASTIIRTSDGCFMAHPDDPSEPYFPTPCPDESSHPATGVVASGALDTIQTTLDGVSIGLDATGGGAVLSPVVDAVNGVISLLRGDYTGAALSAWAAVPWVGVSGNLARLGRNLPVGSQRSPMHVPSPQNPSGVVNGVRYTGHAFDQMQGRGLTPSVVEDTIARGVRSPGHGGATVYTSDQARVVVNSNGSVITVMGQ